MKPVAVVAALTGAILLLVLGIFLGRSNNRKEPHPEKTQASHVVVSAETPDPRTVRTMIVDAERVEASATWIAASVA